MDPVVHFEMPYDDPQRMSRFYREAFGWDARALGADMGNYVVATTTATPEGRPTAPGTINGGFFERKPDWPAQHPSVVIAVQDIARACARVTRSGETVLGEPMDIPGVGRHVSFIDTEGNRVSMLRPLPRAGGPQPPRQGAPRNHRTSLRHEAQGHSRKTRRSVRCNEQRSRPRRAP